MSQGDHVRINSKKAVETQLPFLLKRVESWDYSTPLVIKFERYDDPRSLGQNALFHIWCREMSEVFVKKVPNATEEGMKFMMKSMFLGTHSIAIGKETYSDQVMPLPKKKRATPLSQPGNKTSDKKPKRMGPTPEKSRLSGTKLRISSSSIPANLSKESCALAR